MICKASTVLDEWWNHCHTCDFHVFHYINQSFQQNFNALLHTTRAFLPFPLSLRLGVKLPSSYITASLLIKPLLELDVRTAPRCKARWILSSWATGHQHSPIRHFWVMSILNQFIAWYIVLIFLTLIAHILIDSAMEERRAKRWTSVCVITWKYKTLHFHTSNVNMFVNSWSANIYFTIMLCLLDDWNLLNYSALPLNNLKSNSWLVLAKN